MEIKTKAPIADIVHDREPAMKEAIIRYLEASFHEEGYSGIGVAKKSARRILSAKNGSEVDVYIMKDGSEVAIGDGGEAKPWAVTITEGQV